MIKKKLFSLDKYILTIFILISSAPILFAADNDVTCELDYELTYSGLKMADIYYSESDYYRYNNINVKNFQCDVETFSNLLAIGGKYRSIVADDNSVRYHKSEQESYNGKRVMEYWFDYDEDIIRIKDSRVIQGDSTSRNYKIDKIDGKYSDSISLFFRLKESIDTIQTPVYINYFNGSQKDSILIESISHEIFDLSETETVPVLAISARIQPGLMPGSKDRIKIYISDNEKKYLIYGRLYMTLGYLELKLLSDLR